MTKSDFQKICSSFSIKDFVPDMPRRLNEAFTKVYNCIMDFYDPDTATITAQRGDIDYIVATTTVTQNLRVGDSSVNFTNLVERVNTLEGCAGIGDSSIIFSNLINRMKNLEDRMDVIEGTTNN